MRNYVSRYCAMIRRETAFPDWAHRNRDGSIMDEENSISSKKLDDANIITTEVNPSELSDSPPQSPELMGKDQDNAVTEKAVVPEKGGNRKKLWPVVAAGAGLFSDGYVNNTTGFAITILETIYKPEQYENSDAMTNLGAITFVGTVVGMLVFGLVADYYSRKAGMSISTVILISFSILAAGSWGIGMPSDPKGMSNMLITMRAFIGVGIGGEYPAGSVACAEVSQMLTKGSRNRYFILFTDFMIDCGFVVSAFVCWLMMYICSVPTYAEPGNSHGLQTSWRVLMGLGAIPPLSSSYLRVKFEDPDQFKQNNSKKAKTPWSLIAKRYGPRLCIVSLIWFIYDFMGYSYSTYSSTIVKSQVPVNENGVQNIKTSFGWSVVFNSFYLPGSFLGAFASDWFGPRLTSFTGVALQGMVGFIMGAKYFDSKNNIGPLVVTYGIFQTSGEFGSGDNVGLICSKTSASAVRGRYYAIAAAIGKVGAFVGNYAFPSIASHYGGIKSDHGQQVSVYISSSSCMVAAGLALLIPELSQESIAMEDIKFRNMLIENGYSPDNIDSTLAEGAPDQMPDGFTARA